MKRISKDFPSGVTLVELMIAVVLISIISLGIVGSFGNIARALQFSKTRTLASNLAQEQMQLLKQQSFNKILVTTATVYHSDFGTELPYDNGYYPPETITEGGIVFTRYTYVQITQEDSGTLTYPGSYTDTGMKAILVSVTWEQGSTTKKIQLRNILGNIETTMSNSIFSGKVKIWPTTTGIVGAKVTVAENVGYEDTSNGTGNYSINVFPGNYTLVATADGYFPARKTVSVAANATTSTDFDLFTMGSGTVRGSAWYNDHLVISQVVASTVNVNTGFSQEYVEIFNPSTSTWSIANGPGSPVVNLLYEHYADGGPTVIAMTYNTLTVGPSSYYLFANTSPVVMAGSTKTADAVYLPTNTYFPDIIWDVSNTGGSGVGDADSVGIMAVGGSDVLDVIGWSKTSVGHNPPRYEGNPYPQIIGFQNGEQYVRRSSTSGVTTGLGRAYDSNDNSNDFVGFNGAPTMFPPRNSSNVDTIVAGTPAYGAFVSANDGLSQVVKAIQTGSPPFAEFQLISVATGTWIVFVDSGTKVLELSTVTVTANTTTMVPNSLTSPSWQVTGFSSSLLNMEATQGYVSGTVTNVLGLPISPSAINVGAGGTSVPASISNGTYFLPITAGTYDIVANQNNQNSSYVSQTSQTVVATLGQVTSDVNFILSQGGRVRGNATRDGVNAIAGVSFVAMDTNDMARAQTISDANGQFLLINLATGTYSIEPILGSGEASTPSAIVSTITAGSTINVGTFTISGAFGYVRGTVTTGGTSLIRSGVLVVASTATITAPPTLSASSLSGTAYYTTNSYEDGTYVLDVRGSTVPYKVYAYYTTFNVSTPTTTVKSNLSVSVTAGNSTSGINFNW